MLQFVWNWKNRVLSLLLICNIFNDHSRKTCGQLKYKTVVTYIYSLPILPICRWSWLFQSKPKQMNVKTIGDITSMMVIYLLLYSAQFQSLPDSFRIITLHYSWLHSSDEYDDTKECGLKNKKPHRTCYCLQKQNIQQNQYILWVI